MNKIFEIGVKKISTESLRQKVIITNLFATLFVSITFIYIFIFHFLELHFLANLLIVVCLFYSSTLLLNYLRKPTWARMVFTLTANVSLLFYSSAFGIKSGIHNVFIAFTAIPFLLFESKNKLFIFMGLAIPLSSILMVKLTGSTYLTSNMELSNEVLLFLDSGMTLATISIVIFSFIFFFISTEKSQQQTMESNQELNKSREVQKQIADEAAFGSLVREIANELKNLVGLVMLLNDQSIQEQQFVVDSLSFSDETKKENLSESLTSSRKINQYVERLNMLLDTMLKYGKLSEKEMEIFPIHSVLNDVLELSKETMKSRQITNSLDLCEENPFIAGYKGLLEQAFLNIILNAIEAIHEGGSIHIYTKVIAKKKFKISFVDDGVGMDPETINKFKDPFFSLKQGHAGLGIPTVLRVVSLHLGHFDVKSIFGGGTSIIFELPLSFDLSTPKWLNEPKPLEVNQ